MEAKNLHGTRAADLFSRFRSNMLQPGQLASIGEQLVGNDIYLDGPFGPTPLVYADYTASGRAFRPIEEFIQEHVLPYYANTHTEGSFCGGYMTGLRGHARQLIARYCGADERFAVIFAGSGATAGLNRLVELFGVKSSLAQGIVPRIIIGPYEHHSNILPWRESGAEIVEIGEASEGGPDLEQLDAALSGADHRPVICAFTAASNVTGIVTDVANITARAKAAGAKIVWDYAGGGPYLPISMQPEPSLLIDAVVVSPHKFIGGPAASGILIVRRDAVVATKPTWPGGGTVKFVSSTHHDYTSSLEAREEAGTPNVVGDIRAALAFMVKDVIGQDVMDTRNDELSTTALAAWKDNEHLELLGNLTVRRLPIFSFKIRKKAGSYVHHQLITRMLSDRFGIQARGGCACAGPYVHRLLKIEHAESEDLRLAIGNGEELRKPGFVRLNFSIAMSPQKVGYILDSVAQLARDAEDFEPMYDVDERRAIFYPKASAVKAKADA